MPTYQREVRVRAPLDEVWQFHSRIDGLEALTPDWMHLRIEDVHRPAGRGDGDEEGEGDGGDENDADLGADLADPDLSDPDVLTVGTSIALSMRPFGVGPRQSWTSRIVRRETGDGAAVFEDVMDDGPFPEWRHRHHFYAMSDDETLVRDRVTYELPVVGGLLGPLGWLGFEPMFRSRHRRTKEILESRDRE
jgi:ligand-binding SRPBCC domain-containing protein